MPLPDKLQTSAAKTALRDAIVANFNALDADPNLYEAYTEIAGTVNHRVKVVTSFVPEQKTINIRIVVREPGA